MQNLDGETSNKLLFFFFGFLVHYAFNMLMTEKDLLQLNLQTVFGQPRRKKSQFTKSKLVFVIANQIETKPSTSLRKI
jgi:hypothetical protein